MRRSLGSLLSLAFCLGIWARPACAGTVQVQSPDVRIIAHTDNFWPYFESTVGGKDLLFFSSLIPDIGTSRVVFNLNGSAVDMQTAVLPSEVVLPVTAVGTGLGAYIEMAKRRGNLTYGVRYTIVADPHLGTGSGYVQIKAYVTNNTPVTADVGLRLLLDIQLIDTTVDDALLSTDNGLTQYTANTLLQAATTPIPSDWWTFDQYPSPNFAARGVTWGNSFGALATQPDAVEFCHWDDVRYEGMYDPHPAPGAAFSSYARPDTAVVLWFTNDGLAGYTSGTQANGDDYKLPPGQTLEFVTYYGINPQPLGLTPTPYFSYTPTPTFSATPSISPTWTVSPTFSPSPTISLTHSITPSWTPSPTFSTSPTQSQTWTISPTFSTSPSSTQTPTATPTPSVSPSFSASPTPTVTPTFSASPTPTPTPSLTTSWTVSPTFSVSRTFSVSPTFSASPTLKATATPEPPDLILTPKPPSPNPSDGHGVWLPYILSKQATVVIKAYSVAGELVKSLDPYDAHGGANEQFWDQRNEAGALVASGVFIYRIDAKDAKDEKVAYMKLAVVR